MDFEQEAQARMEEATEAMDKVNDTNDGDGDAAASMSTRAADEC